MRYDNSRVRRRDRLLDETRAREVLLTGEYGILSLWDGNDPYGILLNYAGDGDALYFHCAPEGKKIDIIGGGAPASFSVVGRTNVIPAKFTTGYESVVATGHIALVRDDNERMKALELIVNKYSPGHHSSGMKYAAASFRRTAILKMVVESLSGKSKNEF